MNERVLIAGGGMGGLAAALALARAGHPVTLVERDPWPASPDVAAAFAAGRRGAPQVHQTHAFLARLAVVLRDRFPDVLDRLLAAGCTTLPVATELGEPRAGDEDLAVLVVRRTTVEWILRSAVLDAPAVEVRAGRDVAGLVTGEMHGVAGPPTVSGLRLDDGTTLEGDLVVAATGRRSRLPEWLAPHGVTVPETVHESGLVYLTRWYRLPPDLDVVLDPRIGGDLGFLKYLAVPGDAGTLSVTLAVRAADAELRQHLSDADAFDRACRLVPGPALFFEDGPLEPIGEVRPMGGLINRRRRFVDETGRPLALGIHAVGDAHTCTNPLYGRGCSLAAVQAVLLADAVAAHPGDPDGRARAYETACRREIEPWFDMSVQMDAAGSDPGSDPDAAAAPTGPGRAMRAVAVAAATDPVIGRAMARLWHLLDTPADLMTDPEVAARMGKVMADPDAYPTPPSPGPSRTELLRSLTTA